MRISMIVVGGGGTQGKIILRKKNIRIEPATTKEGKDNYKGLQGKKIETHKGGLVGSLRTDKCGKEQHHQKKTRQ